MENQRTKTLCATALLLATLATAQTPTFEVASIRLHAENTGFHPQDCSGGRFVTSGMLLGDVLSWTYELTGAARSEFLQRVPAAMRQNSYDIQAKAPDTMTDAQCRQMVQALFADRFKLAFHMQEKEFELSDLVVARGGPKMSKALPTDAGTDIAITINGRLLYTEPPIADPALRASTKGMTMQELAQRLPTTAPQPVADKTGLEGRYKIELRYSTVLAANDQEPADPPIDAALAQLGLRLEKHKTSIKVPILDHIEPPDPNAN